MSSWWQQEISKIINLVLLNEDDGIELFVLEILICLDIKAMLILQGMLLAQTAHILSSDDDLIIGYTNSCLVLVVTLVSLIEKFYGLPDWPFTWHFLRDVIIVVWRVIWARYKVSWVVWCLCVRAVVTAPCCSGLLLLSCVGNSIWLLLLLRSGSPLLPYTDSICSKLCLPISLCLICSL